MSGNGSSPGSSPQATAPVTPSGSPSTGGFVQADPATNSLIITAPEPMYRQLRSMIDQLDSRRAQVYIETMIVEVIGDDTADFGFQWLAVGDTTNKYFGAAGTNFGTGGSGNLLQDGQNAANPLATAKGLGQGLNVAVIRNYGSYYGLSAVLKALQTRASTNIVSTPNLITLDNEEAKIVVGKNVPFVTGQYTTTAVGATPFQTIERKDVGITLRIRPQIGENGTVRMTLFQESSSIAEQATGTARDGPTTLKKSIESTVVVDDGQIIVLGGLIEDSISVSKSQVPLLGDIPYLGALFRSESRTKVRTNQMVFLRPVIMRDGMSSNKLAIDRYEMIRGEQKGAQVSTFPMMPVGGGPLLPPLQSGEDAAKPAARPTEAPQPAAN
jgi:general secretion pathway protein D